MQAADGNSATTTQPLSLTIATAQPDVASYYVMKMESFVHLDAANVVPDTNHGPFTGILGIVQASPDAVPIANVYLPGGAVRGFPFGGGSLELQIRDAYATQAALDADYTNGNYTFAMATVHNGFQFPVLTLPTAAYPTAQHVSNFAAAQAINPTSPFTLQWSNPSDATTNDYIWVVINNASGSVVFSTPEPATSPFNGSPRHRHVRRGAGQHLPARGDLHWRAHLLPRHQCQYHRLSGSVGPDAHWHPHAVLAGGGFRGCPCSASPRESPPRSSASCSRAPRARTTRC